LEPEAVCVIPACHTNNGKARWISLKLYNSIALYSEDNSEVPGLKCYTQIPCADITNISITYLEQYNKLSDINITTVSSKSSIACESYIFGAGDCDGNTSSDINLYQFMGLHTTSGYVMSGKLKDPINQSYTIDICFSYSDEYVTPNLYYQNADNLLLLKNPYVFKYKNSSGELNPICDLDGKTNTDILMADNIYNYHAVATQCRNYCTAHTNPGDWYLPSAGELAYLLSRWYTINWTIHTLYNTNTNWASNYL
jgi:hypothetical protein